MPTTDTFESGVNWTVGDLVTADTLKNTIEDATPKKALIEGLSVAGSVDPVNDGVMIYDHSNDGLRKIKVQEIMSSASDGTIGLLKIRDSIQYDSTYTDANGIIQPNVEVVTNGPLTSFSGVYSCVSGVVAITPTTGINIKTGDIIDVVIAGGDASIVGEFVNTGTTGFVSYNARNPSVANSSGSCTFHIVGCLKVDATGVGSSPAPVSLGNAYVRGDLEVIDDATIKGDLETRGTTNHKNDVQYNGNSVYGLYDFDEYSVPFVQLNAETAGNVAVYCNQWYDVTTISSLTKTNKEIWDVEFDFTSIHFVRGNPISGGVRFRIIIGSTSTVLSMQSHGINYSPAQGITHYERNQIKVSAIIPAGTTFTSDSIKLQAWYSWVGTPTTGAIHSIGYGGSAPDPTVTNKMKLVKYIKP